MTHPPSVAIEKIRHHFQKKIIPTMSSQVIEKFQSPFDSGGLLDAHKKNLVAPLMVIVATNFFCYHRRLACHIFF
jgi:hypothetical protein